MAHILILKAQDNPSIIDEMSRAAIDIILSNKHSYDEILIPSVKDLPLSINLFAESLNYEAVLCLGVVKESPLEISSVHYEHIVSSIYEYSTYFGFIVGSGIIIQREDAQDFTQAAIEYTQKITDSLCIMIQTIRQLNSMDMVKDGRSQKHN